MSLQDALPADVVGQMEKLKQALASEPANDPIGDLMERYGLGYPEAVERLAELSSGEFVVRATTKHLTFDAEIKADEDDGVFEGLASTFGNIDLTGDIIKRGAFKASLAERPAEKVKLLFQHDSFAMPIGIFDSIKETRAGLAVTGRLALRTVKGAEVHELMKMGALDALSIGFRTVEEETDKGGRRILKEVDLLEISVVNFPANPKAQITTVKEFDTGQINTRRDVERVLRDAGLSRTVAKHIAINWSEPALRDAGAVEGQKELVAKMKILIRQIERAA